MKGIKLQQSWKQKACYPPFWTCKFYDERFVKTFLFLLTRWLRNVFEKLQISVNNNMKYYLYLTGKKYICIYLYIFFIL